MGLRYRSMLPPGSVTSLPPTAQAAFDHAFSNFIQADGGLVRDKNDRTLEARAAYFSTWLTSNGYTHQSLATLTPGAGIVTLALFLMSVASGDNIQNRSSLCTKTLAGYRRAATTYIEEATSQTLPLYNEKSLYIHY